MKVSSLITFLGHFDPDEDICALIYRKQVFGLVSDQAWSETCDAFEECGFHDVYDQIQIWVDDFEADYKMENESTEDN